MTLRYIRATYDCDRCGREFSIDLDPAQSTESESLWDYCVGVMRNGIAYYRGPIQVTGGHCSYHDHMFQCAACEKDREVEA